jgi:hypothetical protein
MFLRLHHLSQWRSISFAVSASSKAISLVGPRVRAKEDQRLDDEAEKNLPRVSQLIVAYEGRWRVSYRYGLDGRCLRVFQFIFFFGYFLGQLIFQDSLEFTDALNYFLMTRGRAQACTWEEPRAPIAHERMLTNLLALTSLVFIPLQQNHARSANECNCNSSDN